MLIFPPHKRMQGESTFNFLEKEGSAIWVKRIKKYAGFFLFIVPLFVFYRYSIK